MAKQNKRRQNVVDNTDAIIDQSKPDVNSMEEDEEDYDEEDDDDYDPSAKEQKIEEDSSDDEKDGATGNSPDYSSIETGYSQIKTRSQRIEKKQARKDAIGGFSKDKEGLIRNIRTNEDIDAIFNDLKSGKSKQANEWKNSLESTPVEDLNGKSDSKPTEDDSLETKKIKIESSYTFAGKVITETKYVEAGSAEAKAYLNSTKSITTSTDNSDNTRRSFVPVIRELPGTKEPVELKIKLKRPSLIDKFMAAQNNKSQKLSTLEKSRLDWASFVDNRRLKDELNIGNKAGYLDKQDFLGRLQEKRDEQYQRAKEEDRARRWQLEQQQN